MADLKISALTGASTPLAGTEVLPIVQSGSTVKVSVANLTAGRAVATAGGSFTDNITQSTAAKGINFTANTNAPGMTSELLNWYEEGTFSPVIIGSTTEGTATYSTQVGRYTRIGNRVFYNLRVVYTGGTGTGNLRVGGLPFTSNATSANTPAQAVYISDITLTALNVPAANIQNNNTYINMFQMPVGGGTGSLIAYDDAGSLQISGHYEV